MTVCTRLHWQGQQCNSPLLDVANEQDGALGCDTCYTTTGHARIHLAVRVRERRCAVRLPLDCQQPATERAPAESARCSLYVYTAGRAARAHTACSLAHAPVATDYEYRYIHKWV